MSTADNHRKRSYRSQKEHYRANTRRMVKAQKRYMAENPGLFGLGHLFKRRSHGAQGDR